MTKQQKDDALMVLGKGCKKYGKYIDQCGNTCAIGALAKAANIDKDKLLKMDGDFISSHMDVVNQITLKFGLSFHHQREIQKLNDNWSHDVDSSVEARTKSVLAYVNRLKVEG